jgi:hypothetical protein
MPPAHVFAARSVAGRRARTTNGSARAALSGIPSTLGESAQPAFTSGVRRSASCAVDGRRIRSGMRIREPQEAVR